MHVERLERLETALRAYVGAESSKFSFNLGVWSSDYTWYEKGQKQCGTAGCAIGLALDQGLFEAEGLHTIGGGPMLVQNQRFMAGFDAITVLFDLDDETARFLFLKAGNNKWYGPGAALQCAERIRSVIDAAQPVKKCAEPELELA